MRQREGPLESPQIWSACFCGFSHQASPLPETVKNPIGFFGPLFVRRSSCPISRRLPRSDNGGTAYSVRRWEQSEPDGGGDAPPKERTTGGSSCPLWVYKGPCPLLVLSPISVHTEMGPSGAPPATQWKNTPAVKNDKKSILSHRGCGSRPLPGRYIPPPSFLSNFFFFFSFLLGLHMYHIPLTYVGHMLDICMTYALPMSCTRVILPDFLAVLPRRTAFASSRPLSVMDISSYFTAFFPRNLDKPP